MALTRWSPFGDLTRLRDEMDRMFERFIEPAGMLPAGFGAWSPNVDVYDRENMLVVEAELPGVNKENVDVLVEDHTLTLRGEMKQEKEKKEEGFYRRERRYGQFMRSIPLPVDVKTDEAKASFHDGILEVCLPKAEEAAKGKKIAVQ